MAEVINFDLYHFVDIKIVFSSTNKNKQMEIH